MLFVQSRDGLPLQYLWEQSLSLSHCRAALLLQYLSELPSCLI
jgi:hypothetical protein